MATSSSTHQTHSQSKQPLDDDKLEIPDDPDRVFGEVVERNDRVCKHCYRRLRRKVTFPRDVGLDHGDLMSFVEHVLPDGAKWNLLDRKYYERVELPQRVEGVYDDTGKSRYCTNCGTVDTHRTPPTRSKEQAFEAAVNVSTTLHELGVAHDWVHLVERVRELKGQPETAGNDFECFRRATAEAIRRE